MPKSGVFQLICFVAFRWKTPERGRESHLLGAVSGIAIALFFKPDYVVNQRLQGTNKYWTYSNSSYADDNTKFVYNGDDSSEFIVDE